MVLKHSTFKQKGCIFVFSSGQMVVEKTSKTNVDDDDNPLRPRQDVHLLALSSFWCRANLKFSAEIDGNVRSSLAKIAQIAKLTSQLNELATSF